MNVVWSPRAQRRALEAVDAIARDRPGAAAAWLDGLLDHVASLDRFAGRGRVVQEIGRPEYRQIMHQPYRVIYRIEARRVVILTNRHSRRSWDHMEVLSDE